MPSTEYATYKQYREPSSGTNWGEPFEFPHIAGPLVYAFRPKDFSASKISLSTWAYCAIANGVISDWNDPALTEDNGGTSLTGGVSQPITFYFRSDSSGATYAITNHLSTACTSNWQAPYNAAPYESSGHSAAWTFGVNSSWPGPGSSGDPNTHFIGETGSPGILAGIQSTPYGTGYVEGAYAKLANPAVHQALLQNGFANGLPTFVDPTAAKNVVTALSKGTA
jgi:phosphate transport system substrate-binding protein